MILQFFFQFQKFRFKTYFEFRRMIRFSFVFSAINEGCV